MFLLQMLFLKFSVFHAVSFPFVFGFTPTGNLAELLVEFRNFEGQEENCVYNFSLDGDCQACVNKRIHENGACLNLHNTSDKGMPWEGTRD